MLTIYMYELTLVAAYLKKKKKLCQRGEKTVDMFVFLSAYSRVYGQSLIGNNLGKADNNASWKSLDDGTIQAVIYVKPNLPHSRTMSDFPWTILR